ncbi:hypothetical protein UNDYM_1631 [Undibacterium sp. YM2]|uniref:Lcl C-terminal domain-containing protein n=1 Tax=Undibacterium sp. YM2 TaxID=2058625 RepID=UPI001331EEAF|nr:DUF1566 domain-containing protein [Undibacterium sp. YM2]BBB65884.1 hypothetical protein UNDYM_1631 [Undibacterium sp. YM2]
MQAQPKFAIDNMVYHPESKRAGIICAIETARANSVSAILSSEPHRIYRQVNTPLVIRYRINPFDYSEGRINEWEKAAVWANEDDIILLPETPQVTINAPKIGTAWQGGIYAGVVAGQDGQPDYHLIHAPAEFEIKDANWQTAIEKAQAPVNGFTDWSLPDRREARLLHTNTPAGFDTDGWYWTSTQLAGYPSYAWMQSFNGGDQGYYHKSDEDRARAVRRLLIIQ